MTLMKFKRGLTKFRLIWRIGLLTPLGTITILRKPGVENHEKSLLKLTHYLDPNNQLSKS